MLHIHVGSNFVLDSMPLLLSMHSVFKHSTQGLTQERNWGLEEGREMVLDGLQRFSQSKEMMEIFSEMVHGESHR
jgi:hypothetical protein